MPLSLEIDNREQKLIKSLTELCELYNKQNAERKDFEAVSFEVKVLDIGDAILRRSDGTCAIIFERKTLADLASSIVDGRHKSQNLRLISTRSTDSSRIELICEVSESKMEFLNPLCNSNPFPGTRISAASLRGAILNGELRDSIVPRFTTDVNKTASHLLGRLIYGRKFEDSLAAPTGNVVIDQPEPTPIDNLSVVIHHRKKKSDNCTAQTCFADMLNAMVGVGMKRAVDIAAYFQTMKNLVDKLSDSSITTKKDLTNVFKEVSGVGPSTAENIYEGVFGVKFNAKS